MVAVMVLPFSVDRLPALDPVSTVVLIDRIPYSVPDAFPLLIRLPKLASLGAGLPGPSLSSVTPSSSDFRPVFAKLPFSTSLLVVSVPVLVRFGLLVLARALRDIGSSEITRDLGSGICAMSIASMRYTLVSHDVVGDMVVGRVSVEVNMYEIVPRSNWSGS